MDQAMRIEGNEPIYKVNLDEPPYIIGNYPPLYILLVAALNAILKIPLFQAGRAISLIFAASSAAIIGLFGSHLTGNKWLGVLSAAIFLGNPYVLIWSSLARVDMMALGFSLLGLWVLYRSEKGTYHILLACALFLLSIFTRQTYLLAGPLAALAWLWHKDKRKALLFGLSFGISSLLIFGIINLITHGGFYTNIVIANINQYEISRMLSLFSQLIMIWPFVIIITLVAAIACVGLPLFRIKSTEIRSKEQEFTIFGIGFFCLGGLVSALTIGKVGSDINYFLELIAGCSILGVVGLNYLVAHKTAIKFTALGLLSLQMIWVLAAAFMLIRSTIDWRSNNLANYDALFTRVQNAVREGTVLSDDYLDMVVLSGQHIYYQPFEYGQLYQAGAWEPTKFTEEIMRGSFPLIVIGGETIEKPCCWPAPVARAMADNYVATVSNSLVILTPKK